MAEFTWQQIQSMVRQLKDEFGSDIATRELAILELKDMERKGCVLDFANRFDECRACPKANECPVLTWEKRHPEYANDELAIKIKILEAGGEEAYKEKLKHQEEAKRKAEEEQQKKLDYDTLKSKLFEILDDFFLNKKYATPAGPLADIVLLIGYEYDRER